MGHRVDYRCRFRRHAGATKASQQSIYFIARYCTRCPGLSSCAICAAVAALPAEGDMHTGHRFISSLAFASSSLLDEFLTPRELVIDSWPTPRVGGAFCDATHAGKLMTPQTPQHYGHAIPAKCKRLHKEARPRKLPSSRNCRRRWQPALSRPRNVAPLRLYLTPQILAHHDASREARCRKA